MGLSCVNISHPGFKKAADRYGIDQGSFRNYVKMFLDSSDINEIDYNSASFKAFIENELKLSGQFYAGDYDTAMKVWERKNPKSIFTDYREAIQAFTELKQLFPDGVTMFKTNDGNYTVRIAQPVKKKGFTLEMQNILDAAPRNKEGKLLVRPNGPVSNLNERQYAQVRTEAFKEWFGDWEHAIGGMVQDKNSYYRGTTEEPIIDSKGNLIIKSRHDSLYDRIGVSEKGVSLSNGDLQLAQDYAVGQIETALNLASEEYDNERLMEEINDNGYYIIRINKDALSNQVVSNGEEVKAIGDVVIPAGSYVIEHVTDLTGDANSAIEGEWSVEGASKVVDENGEPLVVYHGTPELFNTFDTKRDAKNGQMLGRGSYFIPDFEKANSYGNVMSVFLNIKNPYDENIDLVSYYVEPYKRHTELPKRGFDGVYWKGKKSTIYVALEPNQIKSATDNVGTFRKDDDNIYYQKTTENKTDIQSEIVKLKQLNYTPLKSLGNLDKIKNKLKQKNVDPLIIDSILTAVNEDRSLLNLSALDVFSLITRTSDKDLSVLYNRYLIRPVISELESHLKNYFDKYGITITEQDMSSFGDGVLGGYDILNKLIYVAKNRNAITLPEEYAHAFVELMGPVQSRRPENKDFTFLMNEVKNTQLYKEVYEKYKDEYKTSNGDPDLFKIKKEAIGQAIAAALINNYDQNKAPASFWQKLEEFVEKILAKFRNAEYVSFDNLVNQIAKDILNNNYDRLNKVNSEGYNLLDYSRTLAEQTQKDGGQAVEFLKYFTKLGNIITGSLSYRYQGSVYRPSLDSIHDIDMIVPKKAHGIVFNEQYVQEASHRNPKNLLNSLKESAYFKNIQKDYPEVTLLAAYPSKEKNANVTVNAIWCKDRSLIDKFASLTGSYSDRLSHFSEEERGKMYLMDFFLNDQKVVESRVIDTENNIALSSYTESFREKQKMGRAKDIFDYQMYRLFDGFKRNSETSDMMFQKAVNNSNTKGTVRSVDSNIVIDVEAHTETNKNYIKNENFRELQESSNRLSEQDISEYHQRTKEITDDERLRISKIFKQQLVSTGSRRGNRLRSNLKSVKHGTSFSFIEDVDPSLFHDIFEIIRKYLPNGELVDLHDSYENIKCYISPDGLSGFAIESDGNLISVFNLSDKRGFLYAIKDYIVELGANHLDGYNSSKQPLAKIYEATLGWSVASMMDYNMEYDHDDIAKNHNNPQVAFMTLSRAERKDFDKDSYDEAQKHQLSFIKKSKALAASQAALANAQQRAKKIFFEEVYNRNLSQYEIDSINYRLQRISENLGDSTWYLRYGRNGNLYIAGYKNRPVTMDDYWSPFIDLYDITSRGGATDTMMQQELFNGKESITVEAILPLLVKRNPNLKSLVKVLSKIEYIKNVPIKLVDKFSVDVDNAAAVYLPSSNSIEVLKTATFKNNSSFGAANASIIHEIVHAITYNALGQNGDFYNEISEQLEAARKHFKKILGDKYFNKDGTVSVYGLTNVHEFLSEALSNSLFIKELAKIKAVSDNKPTNVFRAFLDSVLRLLKIKKDNVSLYDNVLSSLEDIIEYYESYTNFTKSSDSIADAYWESLSEDFDELDRNDVEYLAAQSGNQTDEIIDSISMDDYYDYTHFDDVDPGIVDEAFDAIAPTYEEQLANMPEDEANALQEELGPQTVVKPEEDPEEVVQQRQAEVNVRDYKKMSSSEKVFIAREIASIFSILVTHLKQGEWKHLLGSEFATTDFTSMTREKIIETVGVAKLLDVVRQTYFNPFGITNPNAQANLSKERRDIVRKLMFVDENWSSFVRIGYCKLIALEGITVSLNRPEYAKQETGNESNEGAAEMATLEEKEREYWQIGFRQLSATSSLSQAIRRMLEQLPVTNNGEGVYDPYGYGLTMYVDSGIAINSILEWTKNSLSIEEMIDAMKEHSESNVWVNSVIEKISDEPIRSLFYTNFRKDFTNYGVVLVTRDSEGRRTFSASIRNRTHPVKALFNKASVLYSQNMLSSIFNVNVSTGNATLNTKGISEMEALIEKIQDDLFYSVGSHLHGVVRSHLGDYQSLLSKFGIELDKNTLADALARRKYKDDLDEFPAYKILADMKTVLLHFQNSAVNGVVSNPFARSEDATYLQYQFLLDPLNGYLSDALESSLWENEKMYYSYAVPSYLGKLTKIIHSENAVEALEKEYGYSKFFKNGDTWLAPWVKRLIGHKYARDVFEHKVQLSLDKIDYTDLTELGYAQSILSEFFAFDKAGKPSDLAWYRHPTLSNKPSNEFIKFYKESGINMKRTLSRQYQDVLSQEIIRIRSVIATAGDSNIEKIANYDISKEDLPKNPNIAAKLKDGTITREDLVDGNRMMFQNSGARFHFLSFLNKEIIGKNGEATEFGKMLIDKIAGREVKDENAFSEAFKTVLDNHLTKVKNEEMANLEKMGMFDVNDKRFRSNLPFRTMSFEKYFEDTLDTYDKKRYETDKNFRLQVKENYLNDQMAEIDMKIEEFVWNDTLACINIIQLTNTDLAYFKNVEDFQKRVAQNHSPGLRLNKSATFKDADGKDVLYSDGKFRTIYLKDQEVKSEIIPQIENIFNEKIKSAKNAEEIRRFKKLKADIIKAFSKVNVTDAQAYTSPTAYRKKLGMQGKWDETMEEAYQRIRSGNFEVDDLGVLWQPLKPFVYTTMNKTRSTEDNPVMSNARVPVQMKNSEYMLLIAGALADANSAITGEQSTLQALFDFMEDSAYDNGVYNGKGIDTIQFVSAIKVGSMGVIDLNGLSYEAARQKLEKYAYLSNTREEFNGTRYNTNYIHEFDSDDYSLQQEVPAHMQDHMQQMGSQIRALICADFEADDELFNKASGKYMKASEVKAEYFDLLAKNIEDSFNELKELVGGSTEYERNRNLEKILLEAIQKDQKYGDEIRKACTINPETGKFTIPLDDPIQSQRIQQLLSSIIKSRINKQKVSGGPTVQVSNFGLSKNLHIVFGEDTKGRTTIDHFECLMTCPTEELENDLMVEENGKKRLLSVQEAIDRGILTEDSPVLDAIGYRIPTEDKYSMAPLKVVGFLPRSAGEGIMLPYEITTLSGSDFDIDKIYLMLKSYKKKGIPRKKFYRKIKETGIISSKDVKNSPYKTLKELVFATLDEAKSKKQRETFTEGTVEKKIYDFYQKNGQIYSEIDDMNSREGKNNRIFDLQYSMLTSNAVLDKMFNPGNFDEQRITARIVRIAELTDKYTYDELSKKSSKDLDAILDELLLESDNANDITRLSTQIRFHQQNMVAGKLIGIFANNNTAHAFMQDANVRLQNLPKNGITFNGVAITNGMQMDPKKGFNGNYVSKVIASFLAASVDAVKDPVLNYMNLNTFTSGPAMVLARLGFDSDSIGLFLSQPVIKELTNKYFKEKNENKGLAVKDITAEYLAEKGLDDRRAYKAYLNTLHNEKFTKDELVEGLQYGGDELATVAMFDTLLSVASDLQESTFLTKFNSAGNASKTIADNYIKKRRISRFAKKVNEGFSMLSSECLSILKTNPLLKAIYEYTLGEDGAADIMFENFFENSREFAQIVDAVEELFIERLNEKDLHKLFNEYVLFKMSGSGAINMNEEYRKKYLVDFPMKFATKIKSTISNPLIDAIELVQPTDRIPIPTLELHTGGMESAQKDLLSAYWEDLYNDEDTKQVAIDLFLYNMYRTGVGFSPKTFLNIAPVSLKMQMPEYVKTIEDLVDSKDKYTHSAYMSYLIQFIRNHAKDKRFVTEYPFIEGSMSPVGDGSTYIYTGAGKPTGAMRDGETMFIRCGKLGKEPVYIKTTPLGILNNALEYNANLSYDFKSVFDGLSIEGEQDITPEEPTTDDVNLDNSSKDKKPSDYVIDEEDGKKMVEILGIKGISEVYDELGEATEEERRVALVETLKTKRLTLANQNAPISEIDNLLNSIYKKSGLC